MQKIAIIDCCQLEVQDGEGSGNSCIKIIKLRLLDKDLTCQLGFQGPPYNPTFQVLYKPLIKFVFWPSW